MAGTLRGGSASGPSVVLSAGTLTGELASRGPRPLDNLAPRHSPSFSRDIQPDFNGPKCVRGLPKLLLSIAQCLVS